MRRLAALVVVSVLVLSAGSAAAKRGPVLATVWDGSVVSLTRVDAMTMQPLGGPALKIGGGAYLVARSPRGATLAFDTGRGAVLSFVDAARLRQRGSVALGEGWIGAAAWPSPRRLVAVLGNEARPYVVVVDPATRKQLARRDLPLHDDLLASAASAGRVVFVLGESLEIAPVRLAVAGVDGAIRSVVLARIAGGVGQPEEGTGILKAAWPALALDPAGRRAAVVGAGGLVAEVDLDTLAVTYHATAARTPARAAKALEGWQRSALWLPSGTLAVTGTDYHATVTNGTEEMSGTAAGLTLLDTRDWNSSTVDDGASFVARAGDVLVAFGGAGLRGYGGDGVLRFQLFASEQLGEVRAVGGLVYVAGCKDRCFRIVDPATGALVGSAKTTRTTQLVG